MAEPDLLELFRKHAQDGQKEMVSLFCNDVRRLSRTKKIKRLLVLGRYAGNSELCGHVLRVLEMLPELPGHGLSCIQGRSGIALPFTGQGCFVQVAGECRPAMPQEGTYGGNALAL